LKIKDLKLKMEQGVLRKGPSRPGLGESPEILKKEDLLVEKKVFNPKKYEKAETVKFTEEKLETPVKVVYVEKESNLNWWFVLTVTAILVVAGIGSFVVMGKRSDNAFVAWPIRSYLGTANHSVVKMALVDTMTQDTLWTVRQSLIQHMTLSYLDRFSCLCMHHLVLPSSNISYTRVCAVYNEHQFYLMLNPRAVGFTKSGSNETTTATRRAETSFVCNGNTYLRNRYNTLFFEWEDEKKNTHYLAFRDSQAACLQLALDEFGGSRDFCNNQ
jgi:hypothetical protein